MPALKADQLLWTAPELLRNPSFLPTKEADVFSFSIICQETLAMRCPYGDNDVYMTAEDIVEKVGHGLCPPFRPTIPPG